MTSYTKTMREAREEMLQSLNENNFEKMRKASKGAKQTLKMKDGSIGMDSFTASAIMQIYDKVNDKNKKTMENLLKNGKKADIVKLMKFAMSKVNAEYVPEDMTVTASTDGGISQRDLDYVQKQLRKLGIRDAVVDQNEMDSNKIDVKTRMSDDKVKKAFDKSKITVNYEHVDLDEKLDKEDEPTIKKVVKMLKKASGAHAGQAKDLEKAVTEGDEIDEGKMSQLHQLMKDGKSAKEIAKIMKLDVKTIQALMDEKSELEENLDGRTREYRQHREKLELMRSKRQDEKRHIDPADIDISATDDDIKAADKNIMMQLRKSVSLRGQFPVEFLDKKKVKVPQKIALAVIAKYNGLRKPMDKEKFQAKIAKSHRDLLMGLKEGFASDAQRRAAFAQGYKAKGKKDKKESTLERMNNKIQERKNG